LIVLDASALVELLLQGPHAGAVADQALRSDQMIHAPHLVDVELTQVLRRLVLNRALPPGRAGSALEDLRSLVIERHPHLPLLARVFELRDSMSAYDGVYVALAEALDAPLLTCDARLKKSHGHRAEILLA
jgi:predicted nucleic acid-binding protein